MVSALRDHLAAGSNLQRIRFIVRTPERAEVFRREIERVLG